MKEELVDKAVTDQLKQSKVFSSLLSLFTNLTEFGDPFNDSPL